MQAHHNYGFFTHMHACSWRLMSSGDAKQASLQLAAGREWPLYVTNMLSFSLLSYTESKHNSIMAHMKVKGVTCRHGAPQELLSDRGANNFLSDLVLEGGMRLTSKRSTLQVTTPNQWSL